MLCHMCGIIGYTGNTDALPVLIRGLRALEYRGYDSAGVAVTREGGIDAVKAVGRIDALERKLAEHPLRGTCGIGHTRWATHGRPSEVNCHPHLSYGGKFAIVHNGIIENCADIARKCAERGVTPAGDTDSELIAHLLELNYDGNALEALDRTVGMLEGSYALCVLCADTPRVIYAAKRRSPLLIGPSERGVCVASDGMAMPEDTTSLIALADGQIARVDESGAEVWSSGRRTEGEKTEYRVTCREAGLCGHRHYMLKEMYEQPEAIARTVASALEARELLRPCGETLLLGCGSSYHAALTALPVIERACGARASALLAGEFICSERISGRGRTAVLLSQSGETADTVAAAEEARARGYRTLAIVNVPRSTLTRVCDDVFCTRAGPEISVATTKGFTTQAAALAALAAPEGGELERAALELPRAAEKALDADVSEAVELFAHAACAFFIGRKVDMGAALEGALKMREITYVPALGIAAGELKHGSISLVTQGTPVAAVCTDRSLAGKAMLSVASVRARGGVVLGVTDIPEVAGSCDLSVMLPEVHPLLSAALSVIPLQRLAYECALVLGRDVDKPRNLAKSVTVE